MRIEERLRDALRAYDRIEPSPDALQRLRTTVDSGSPGLWRGRAMASALVAVLATGAVVGARLVSDRPSEELRLVTPVQRPTGPPTTEPSPSSSPSPSPKGTPSDNKTHFVSEDGTWEFWYSKSWFGPTTGKRGWSVYNFNGGESSVPTPIEVQFHIVDSSAVIHDNSDPTLDELQAHMCSDVNDRQIRECKQVEINSRVWAWALVYSEEEGPTLSLGVGTIVGDKSYFAYGYVPGESNHQPFLGQIIEVFESFILHA